MAKEQALQFITRASEDQSLRTKLEAVAKDGIAALAKFAKESGFDVTAEELQSAAVELRNTHTDEISDDALESVAGGSGSGGSPAAPGINSSLIGLFIPAVQGNINVANLTVRKG